MAAVIKKDSKISIAAACFSMYAYKELKDFDFEFQPKINKQQFLDFESLRFLESLLSIKGSLNASTCPEAFQIVGCIKMAESIPDNVFVQQHHAVPPVFLNVVFQFNAHLTVVIHSA